MSEPTSRPGEPDKFAAIERCMIAQHWHLGHREGFAQCEAMECKSLRYELNAARDRERVYRELVDAANAHFGYPSDDAAWERFCEALAEVAKMG